MGGVDIGRDDSDGNIGENDDADGDGGFNQYQLQNHRLRSQWPRPVSCQSSNLKQNIICSSQWQLKREAKIDFYAVSL